MTKDCDFFTLLESGDVIMADRGFDVADDMPAGVGLNIPPFLNGASQLSVGAENGTRKIFTKFVVILNEQCTFSVRYCE